MRALLLLLAALPLRAAADANAILQHLVEREKQNAELARQYTYLEDTVWSTYDKRGQLHKDSSETHEVIFVEGVKYRKLIARNGKRLPAREAAQVEKEMRETAAQRRRHPQYAPGGSIGFGRGRADLGSLSELLTLFENRLVGEEDINGRPAWVIESAPANRAPASPHERDVLAFRKKLWIDQADNVVARMVATVSGEGIYTPDGAPLAAPGSSIAFENGKIDDRVWQPAAIVLDVQRQTGTAIRPWGRTEYRQSRYQKFDVQSTITVEPPKESIGGR